MQAKFSIKELFKRWPAKSELTAVKMEFSGLIHGHTSLLLTRDDARRLACKLLSETRDPKELELDAVKESVLEFSNILLNRIVGKLVNYFEGPLQYAVPVLYNDELSRVHSSSFEEPTHSIDRLLARIPFTCPSLEAQGLVTLLIHLDQSKSFMSRLESIQNLQKTAS